MAHLVIKCVSLLMSKQICVTYPDSLWCAQHLHSTQADTTRSVSLLCFRGNASIPR